MTVTTQVCIFSSEFQDRLISVRLELWWVGQQARPKIAIFGHVGREN